MNTPVISWNAMLNMEKVELELITDPDMYIFFEKGMRGGASDNSTRYNEVNNNYLKSYDSKHKSKHIIYSDKTLYVVIQCLSFFQQTASNE